MRIGAWLREYQLEIGGVFFLFGGLILSLDIVEALSGQADKGHPIIIGFAACITIAVGSRFVLRPIQRTRQEGGDHAA